MSFIAVEDRSIVVGTPTWNETVRELPTLERKLLFYTMLTTAFGGLDDPEKLLCHILDCGKEELRHALVHIQAKNLVGPAETKMGAVN